MAHRRDLLAAGLLGAAALGSGSAQAQPAAATGGAAPLPTNSSGGGRWRPNQKLGLGGNPLGNGFRRAVPEADALATVQAAWDSGVRLFDTSPWYGLGLSERRMGLPLSRQERDSFVLATKVGRVLTPDPSLGLRNDAGAWRDAPSFRYRYDYTADGVRRSIEDSLQRLGLARIDVVFVHDLAPSNDDLGRDGVPGWREQFEVARRGAFPALTRMREEGLIKAWGMGVNDPEPILAALEVAEPDIFLAAAQYSILDHERALEGIIPACRNKGVSLMIGGPLNAGFVVGRDRFNYGGRVPDGMAQKRDRMRAAAERHGTDLRTAALQFLAANPTVSCFVPGARSAEQATENTASMRATIPPAFWAELKRDGLIAAGAPVPAA